MYSAAKAAVICPPKSFAELAPAPIWVVAIYTEFVTTPLKDEGIERQRRQGSL